ncbi:MAG: hypothetical protein OXN89_01595 [Bryobacterales bacterium]|nr:hypothetical protein [Bryobacterales bacterium]
MDDHNANAKPSQILLVLNASIHSQHGIETLIGELQQFAIRCA